MRTRVCKRCGVEKVLQTDYYENRRICKECAAAFSRKRVTGPREVNAWMRRWIK